MAETRTLTVISLDIQTLGRQTKRGPIDYRLYKVKTEEGDYEIAQTWGKELKVGNTGLFKIRPAKGKFPMSIEPVQDQKKIFNDNRGELSMIAQDLARISSRIKKLLNDTEQ